MQEQEVKSESGRTVGKKKNKTEVQSVAYSREGGHQARGVAGKGHGMKTSQRSQPDARHGTGMKKHSNGTFSSATSNQS